MLQHPLIRNGFLGWTWGKNLNMGSPAVSSLILWVLIPHNRHSPTIPCPLLVYIHTYIYRYVGMYVYSLLGLILLDGSLQFRVGKFNKADILFYICQITLFFKHAEPTQVDWCDEFLPSNPISNVFLVFSDPFFNLQILVSHQHQLT